jgi:hypothetical protein
MIRFRKIRASTFDAWMAERLIRSPDGRYALRALDEQHPGRAGVWDELSGYVQEAHDDARRKLRKALAPTLSPFLGQPIDPASGYPQDLHVSTLMGYLGEVMAGLIAEHKDVHGAGAWMIPAFFFRFHQAAFHKLERRQDVDAQGGQPPSLDDTESVTLGRIGNDVLAFRLAADGELAAMLVCEAKCLGAHDSGTAKKAHEQLSDSAQRPPGIRELVDILGDYETTDAREWRERLRRFSFDLNRKVPRSDMLLYLTGNSPTGRGGRLTWLQADAPAPEYAGGRALEVVEVHLGDPRAFAKAIYRPTP